MNLLFVVVVEYKYGTSPTQKTFSNIMGRVYGPFFTQEEANTWKENNKSKWGRYDLHVKCITAPRLKK